MELWDPSLPLSTKLRAYLHIHSGQFFSINRVWEKNLIRIDILHLRALLKSFLEMVDFGQNDFHKFTVMKENSES